MLFKVPCGSMSLNAHAITKEDDDILSLVAILLLEQFQPQVFLAIRSPETLI